jgi:hypothetical protein
MSENQKMERMRQNIQEFISNPVGKTRELSHDYGLDKMELSKIVIITSTALLVISINAVYTMQSVQSDLKQTDQSVQQASAVINSDRFQDAMNTLQRIESDRLTNQLQAAEESLNNLDSSFENVNTAQDKVDQTQRTYQWMSLISILGIISGVALRYM